MKSLAQPVSQREVCLYSAGMYAGMRNVAMARAAGTSGPLRKELVRTAREWHHVYLARLREAQAATWGKPLGYYVPKEIEPVAAVTPAPAPAPFINIRVREAS